METTILSNCMAKVRESYANVPDNEAMIEKIYQKFQDIYHCPLIDDFSKTLGRELDEDFCRSILFNPSKNEAECFAMAVLNGSEKLQHTLITFLYLIHRKNIEFFQEFLCFGGFEALSSLLLCENLYIRGQVVETVLTAVDCDVFDWFEPHCDDRTLLLHKSMLNLARSPRFLRSLLCNRNNSFPGGGFLCLQIIGFWISWVRGLYVSKNADGAIELHVGMWVLSELQQWYDDIRRRKSMDTSLKDEEKDKASTDYECELLKTLYDDIVCHSIGVDIELPFQNVQWIRDDFVYSKNSISSNLSTPLQLSDNMTNQSQSLEDKVLALKEEGNRLFALSSYEDSLAIYQQAHQIIDEKETSLDNKFREDMISSISFNISNVYWKLYLLSNKDLDLDECGRFAQRTLSLTTDHIKACYRLANVFYKQGKYLEAVDLIQSFLHQSFPSPNLKGLETLKMFLYKCMAAVMKTKSDRLINENEKDLGAGTMNHQNNQMEAEKVLGLDKQTSRILAQLKKRQIREQRHLSHAFQEDMYSDRNLEETCTSAKNEHQSCQETLPLPDYSIGSLSILESRSSKPEKEKVTTEAKTIKKKKKQAEEFFVQLKKCMGRYDSLKQENEKQQYLVTDVKKLWDEIICSKISLKNIIQSRLEESILGLLIDLAMVIDDKSNSHQILAMIQECERYEIIKSLLIIDKEYLDKLRKIS